MSVQLHSVLVGLGMAPDDLLKEYPSFSLVSFAAGDARALGQAVAADPLKNDPAHGSVCGKKTKSIQNGLIRASSWQRLNPPQQPAR